MLKMRFERELSSPNEVFEPGGEAISRYRPVLEEMERIGPKKWDERIRQAHERMLELQRGLGISCEDKTHPTDYLPRIVPASDWAVLERGLAQRMLAINEFLRRLEAGDEEVVPGAMTRVAAPGSKLVNISSGGKMKDTWVLK